MTVICLSSRHCTKSAQARYAWIAMAAELSTVARGQRAEDRALAYLQQQGLVLLDRNYRCRFGEIDLVMQERQLLVFVEVRSRRSAAFGGAAASVSGVKQRRLWQTAEHYLMQYTRPPVCRFDLVAIDGGSLSWLPNVLCR